MTQKNLKRGHFIDAESIRKTLKTFNFPTINAILTKLTTDIYLNKVFQLPKSWGITHRLHSISINKKTPKMSQKTSFLAQFGTFPNTSVKKVAYLMHHFACYRWSKFQTKLTTF